jgi:hypothetical protein
MKVVMGYFFIPKRSWAGPRALRYDVCAYRGTSLIRDTPFLGPYSRTIPKVLRWS